jgi:hypothetical protein
MRMKSAIVLGVLLGGILWLSGCAAMEHREREATVEPLPPLVLAALNAEFPTAAVGEAKWTKEEGIALIEVELEQGDQDIEVKVTSEGVIAEIERDVEVGELPQAVKEVLAKTAPGEIEEAAKIEIRAEPRMLKLRRPAGIFDLDIEKDGTKGEMAVSATCVVLRQKWESKDDEGDDEGDKEGDDEGEDHDGDHERKAKRRAVDPGEIEKVTQVVHALMPEAVVGAVEQENEDGMKLYSVELTEADKKMEAKVSRDGVVMETETEMAVEDVPQPVKDVVEKAAPGARITGAEKREVRAAVSLVAVDPPKVVYEVKVKGKGEMRIPAEGLAPAAPVAPAVPVPQAAPEKPISEPKADLEAFQDMFSVDKANLVPNGVNPYWIPLTWVST